MLDDNGNLNNQLKDKSEQQLIEAGSLSMTGQLAAGMMHEIRNPLTTVKGFLQLMSTEKVINMEYIKLMLVEIDRMEQITEEFMSLGKPSNRKYSWVNINKLLMNMIHLVELLAFKKRIRFQFSSAFSSLYIYCDEVKIKQVFINLMKNGIEAMQSGGLLQVNIASVREDKFVKIDIVDEGIGISSEDLKSIGKPFFTTKKTGNGLGLMMCYIIIGQHNGKISVQSEKDQGTTFSIELPNWSKTEHSNC